MTRRSEGGGAAANSPFIQVCVLRARQRTQNTHLYYNLWSPQATRPSSGKGVQRNALHPFPDNVQTMRAKELMVSCQANGNCTCCYRMSRQRRRHPISPVRRRFSRP